MATSGIILVSGLLLVAAALPWLGRLLVRTTERRDGAPTLALVRVGALAQIVSAIVLVGVSLVSGGRLAVLGHIWRHDVWSALLFGVLAGLFLHFAGGGSPLPIASLRAVRSPRAQEAGAGPATAALFVLGEMGGIMAWFGVGLPSLLRALPRLPSLLLVAAGYGLGRAAAAQDHPLLGAIDGLLLGLLYLLTGSLLAVLVAHLVADLWAYVSAASHAEEMELAIEAGEPQLPHYHADPASRSGDATEPLG
jgi:hypothetical protein